MTSKHATPIWTEKALRDLIDAQVAVLEQKLISQFVSMLNNQSSLLQETIKKEIQAALSSPAAA